MDKIEMDLENQEAEIFQTKEMDPNPLLKNTPFSKDIFQKLAQKTVFFIKKNKFIKIDFIRVLKVSLACLLVEYLIYFGLQLCFGLIPVFYNNVVKTPIAIPIVFAVLFLITAILILAFQLSSKKCLVNILKCFEFICFGFSLSTVSLTTRLPCRVETRLHFSFRCSTGKSGHSPHLRTPCSFNLRSPPFEESILL